MNGIPALDLWDVVREELSSTNSTKTQPIPASGNRCETGTSSRNTPKSKPKGNRDVDQLSHVDYVTTNTHSFQGESQLYIFEDNEAVIKMIIKGRSPTMRHVSRTHRVAIRTNLQTLTKGSCTRDEWNHLLRLLNIMNFSMLKAECLVKEGTGRYFRRRFGDGEAEIYEFGDGETKTYKFGVAQSVECEEKFCARCERFQ